jgi:nucleoside-diphosphate-sugar epimerase
MRLSESCAVGSKAAAERVAVAMIGHDHLPAIIMHPTAPTGPRQKPMPTHRAIIEAASGRVQGFALQVFTNGVNNFSFKCSAV